MEDDLKQQTDPSKSVLAMVAIADIVVGTRFRQDLGDLDTLAASVARHGLLHAIGITKERRLVFGARRLEVCPRLGWTEMPAHVLDLDDLLGAERDEILERKGFTPSDAVASAQALNERERARAEAN